MAKDESRYDTEELYGGGLFDDDNENDEGSEGASASASSSPTPTPTLSSSDIESPQQDYYSYMADWNNVMPLESDEDYAKRRKRAKNAALFGAISDGISSLANLYATTKYAPSAYNANTPTMTGKVLERYDKMEDERKKDKAAWAAGAQRARQLDEAKKEKDRSWKLTLEQWAHQQEKDANTERRAEAEEERKRDLHPSQKKAAEAQAETAANQATISGAQAKYAEEKEQANLNNIKAQTAAHNRSNRGESSGKGPITFLGKNYDNETNWKKDVMKYHKALGLPEAYGVPTYGIGGERIAKKEMKLKTIERCAAEVERYLAEEPEEFEQRTRAIRNGSGRMFE